jgi:hypothetical protein
MWTVYEMIGLPEEQRDEAAHHADGMVSWADADVAAGREPGQVINDSLVGLLTLGLELAEQRRAAPAMTSCHSSCKPRSTVASDR